MIRSVFKSAVILPLFAVNMAGMSLPVIAAGVEPEPLTLRVQDAVGVAGGVTAIVIRTYASRPIRQGQICVVNRLQRDIADGTLAAADAKDNDSKSGLSGPFSSLVGAIVFSESNDAIESAKFLPGDAAQSTMLQFRSDSASVNAADGPMMVLYYRLRNDLTPEDRFTIGIDVANTFLVDEAGAPIHFEARDGELRIRAPFESVNLGMDSEEPLNNRVMMSVQTDELIPVSSGQIGFRYPATILPGRPKIRIDPRYGNASWSIDYLRDVVIVRFDSPDNTLNRVPGDIVWIAMEIDNAADPTANRRIWLDPVHTFLYGANGASIPLDLEYDVIP